MKKGIATVLLMMLVITTSHAQFRFGAKGGANLSTLDMTIQSVEIDFYKPRIGFHAGLMAEYMFSQHFGLQTELMYVNSGANFDGDKYKEGTGFADEVILEGYVNMNTFQMPLYLKTKFNLANNMKLYLMGGGFASYSPEANQHLKLSGAGESLKLKWSLFEHQVQIMGDEEDNVYAQHRFSSGVAVEGGIEINQFMVGVGFRQVLNNMSAVHFMGIGEPTVKMWTANLSVGYYF